jgi:hypothetical protein
MDNRDEITIWWLGHPIFRDKKRCQLFVRRIPTFFENIPSSFDKRIWNY